jgi:hypothetical protein
MEESCAEARYGVRRRAPTERHRSLSSFRLQDASSHRLRFALHEPISRCSLTPCLIVREHFSSPLLQYAAADGGRTFVLVECPSAPRAPAPILLPLE